MHDRRTSVAVMRAVVILANPNPESLSHAAAATAASSLQARGHDVVVHDLYAEGFRAAMSADERRSYHGDQPVLDDLVATHVADIRSADLLVFVYPTWWAGLPAMLKGWVDRVMVPGVAFRFDIDHRVQPNLTNVKRIIGISTYGSRWVYVKAINDNGRRTLVRTVRLSTGLLTRSTWLAMYRMDTAGPERCGAFLRKIAQTMESL